jgi:hypothetical protein
MLAHFAELDGSNKMTFYWIDLLEVVKRYIQDPSYANKLYHAFEMATDDDGNRMFDKANSGMVFEVFQLMDPTSAPVLIIVASDGSHKGNISQHPMYCEQIQPFNEFRKVFNSNR